MAGRRVGGGRCVRRSRVVLASVADVKLAEAKSAQPGADTPLIRLATVTKRNSSPGRARRKPLKPLRGESRVISGVLVVTTVCYYQCTRAAGAPGTRLSLRPLISKGGKFPAKLARMARRDREAMSTTTCCLKIGSGGWAKRLVRRSSTSEGAQGQSRARQARSDGGASGKSQSFNSPPCGPERDRPASWHDSSPTFPNWN
jgi:hypothetical protein